MKARLRNRAFNNIFYDYMHMTIEDHKSIGIIGLGKMGRGIALQLAEKEWNVVAYNRTASKTDKVVDESSNTIKPAYSYQELIDQLPETKVIWVMVPSGDPVKTVIETEDGITPFLSEGDYLIDAGNSQYKLTQERYEMIEAKGIKYVDAGVSGGPGGARNGACIMVGGHQENFDYLEPVFKELTVEGGYEFFPGKAAGHFVKMVHNGIEYGMMQAIAEGFDVMKQAPFDLNLTNVAKVYENGSVIESALVTWMRQAFEQNGEDLEGISKVASHSGEGEWTIDAAEEMGIPVSVIKGSLQARIDSESNPNYQAQIISALREQFGGHPVRDN